MKPPKSSKQDRSKLSKKNDPDSEESTLPAHKVNTENESTVSAEDAVTLRWVLSGMYNLSCNLHSANNSLHFPIRYHVNAIFMNDASRSEAETGNATYVPPSWPAYNPTKPKKTESAPHRLAPDYAPSALQPSGSSSSSSSLKSTQTLAEKFSSFLVDVQLQKCEDALRAAGYAEVADLEAATDGQLTELGNLKLPEISRLRRYLITMTCKST